ncbi:MAG TPA: DUF4398 domain-containing protein [Steroidobacteraceae bacterium]|nr:DUF4398 domain-containing protein [Steroidobacteraceae bacterium]
MRRNAAMAAAAVAVAGIGCASNEPRPTEDLTRARVLIEQAGKAGAQQYASAELQSARDKLRRADTVVEDDTAEARRLAVEASLDAELAAAKTRSGKAKTAAEEVAASVATLREEAARGAGAQQNPDMQQGPATQQNPAPQQKEQP